MAIPLSLERRVLLGSVSLAAYDAPSASCLAEMERQLPDALAFSARTRSVPEGLCSVSAEFWPRGAGTTAPGDECKPDTKGDAVRDGHPLQARGAVRRLGWVGGLLFVGLSRQCGLHDGVPYNWFGVLAEGCPLGASRGVAMVAADRAGVALRQSRDRS